MNNCDAMTHGPDIDYDLMVMLERAISILNNSSGRTVKLKSGPYREERIYVLNDSTDVFIDRGWYGGGFLSKFVLVWHGTRIVIPINDMPAGFGLHSKLGTSTRHSSPEIDIQGELMDFIEDYVEEYGVSE